MADIIQVNWADVLRHEGILAKGYGLLPKYTMLDRELSLGAKTIYAFLCSLAGNGTTAYPSVETIKSYLGIGETAYSAQLKQLLDAGYILREKRREANSRFAHNLYTIAQKPKKFTETCETEGSAAVISADGILSAGYGMIPRAVMFDPRLDYKAKGLYAYLAAFTGAGKTAFPERDRILQDLHVANNTYYKYLHQLQALNYITVSQSQNGRFGANVFTLNTNPQVEQAQKKNTAKIPRSRKERVVDTPCIKNPGMEKPCAENTKTEKPSMKKPCVEKPNVKKTGIISNNRSSNKPNSNTRKNINLIHHLAQLTGRTAGRIVKKTVIEEMDNLKREELQKLLFQWFQVLPESYDPLTAPEIMSGDRALVCFIVDYLLEKKPFIGGGLRIGREEMAYHLLSLTKEDITAVRERMENAALSEPIRNPKAYGLLALYNQAAAGGLGQTTDIAL